MKPMLLLALCGLPALAMGQDLIRHPIPNSDFPIAQAVEVPAGKTLVFLSGTVPAPLDPTAEKFTPAYWGDTTAQTVSVMKKIEANLKALGLGLGDVVKMQAFLVAPPGETAMDFSGFMTGYTQFYGPKAETRLPTRTTVQIAGLAAPGMLVEIEVTAVR